MSRYTLTQPTGLADITPLAITGHITADDEVYDGTTAATIFSRTLTGVISGDTVRGRGFGRLRRPGRDTRSIARTTIHARSAAPPCHIPSDRPGPPSRRLHTRPAAAGPSIRGVSPVDPSIIRESSCNPGTAAKYSPPPADHRSSDRAAGRGVRSDRDRRGYSTMSLCLLTGICLALLGPDEGGERKPKPSQFEKIPPEEATQIDNIIRLTVEQQKRRYPGATATLRGVHPKDHGCVQATFEVVDTLPEALRVGVFAKPGTKYDAWIRFSNAAVLVGPDSPTSPPRHGSRGMAIKLMGVVGTPLVEGDGPVTQDFLMVNHPVFAFANVEDYEALSQVLLKDTDNPTRFFVERIHLKDGKPDLNDPSTRRALRSKMIAERIQSLKVDGDRGAYQEPPASPVDNTYFSAAPYLFGDDQVMKYSAAPVDPQAGGPGDISDPGYLRKALYKRLNDKGAKDVVFNFRVQVRDKAALDGKLDTEIEDACTLWDEATDPWVTVAKITIRPQNFDTEARKAQCEALFFTPWHGIAEHQPIGGINRLKLGVYRASSAFRHFPKEPAGFEKEPRPTFRLR